MVDPELLIEVPMFQTLPVEERKRLAGLMKEEALPAGRVLFEVGDPGASMYIIVRGKIRISIAGDSGEEVQLAALGGGEFFGELALLDQNPRSARATAIFETMLYSLDRESFLAFVGGKPDAALSMLSAMAKRLRHTDDLMRSRASFDVNEEFKKHETRGGRMAEGVATVMGSWAFMTMITLFALTWVLLVAAFGLSWLDEKQFPLLAFILGVFQTFTGPIIMMSQNRDQIRDRIRADADFKVNLKNEVAIEKALERIEEMRRQLPDLRRQMKEQEVIVRKSFDSIKKSMPRFAGPAPAPATPGAGAPAGVPGADSGHGAPIGDEVVGESTAVYIRPLSAPSAPSEPVGSGTSRAGLPLTRGGLSNQAATADTPDPDEDDEDDAPADGGAPAGVGSDDAKSVGEDTVGKNLAESLKKFRAQAK